MVELYLQFPYVFKHGDNFTFTFTCVAYTKRYGDGDKNAPPDFIDPQILGTPEYEKWLLECHHKMFAFY
jgi:hypothetical protein